MSNEKKKDIRMSNRIDYCESQIQMCDPSVKAMAVGVCLSDVNADVFTEL